MAGGSRGSRGIRESHEYVRKGGATARVMLVQAAADAWKVPVAECSIANSVITHNPSGRKTTFGVVAEAAARIAPPKDVPLKDPKDRKIIGKPIKRLDTPDKVTGKQIYGRLQNAGDAQCHHQGMPGFRRQGEEASRPASPSASGLFEASKSKSMPQV